MLEAGVVRPREHQVRKAELLDAMQPLQLRAMQQFQEDPADLHASVHAVVDYLMLRPGHGTEGPLRWDRMPTGSRP